MKYGHKRFGYPVIAVSAALLAALSTGGLVYAQSSELDAAFQLLADYREGDDPRALGYIRRRVSAAENTFTLRRDLESRLLEVVQRPSLSPAAREFAMEQLYRVATERSVTMLEPMLYDPATSDLARKVLEQTPSDAATDVLVEAMKETPDALREGIIYSLGARKDPQAAKAITKFSGRGDPDVVRAAIWALGEISGPVAVKDLRWCRANTLKQHRDFAGDALLRAAERYVEMGETEAATEIYELMYLEVEPDEIRREALRGMIRARGDDAIHAVLRVLRSAEPQMIDIAFDALADMPGEMVSRRCAAVLPTLAPHVQIRLIDVLARRNDPVALPTLHELLDEDVPQVRRATIEALGRIGDHRSAAALMTYLLRPQNRDEALVRQALVAMPGPGVNDELAEWALGPNRRMALIAIDVLVARKARNAVPALRRVVERADAQLRDAALEAISVLAVRENLPSMLDMMLKAEDESTRLAARDGALTALQEIATEPNSGRLLGEILARPDLPASFRVHVAELVGEQYDAAALSVLETTARKDEGAVGAACIAVLSDWPQGGALDAFAALAKSARRHENRSAVVMGYLAQLESAGDTAAGDRKEHYRGIERLLESPDEKRAYLESLRQWGTSEAGELAGKLARDDDVGEEAESIEAALTGN